MVYDFDLKTVAPIIQGLLTPEPQEYKPTRPLPLLTEEPIEQPPQEPQEQISGTDMVNRAMASAIPQAPNPYALNMKRDIVQAKKAYDDATTDEQRATAQTQANFLRDIASTAGIDLSGYGSNDSYGDAYKNLYSQQAQDIMAALQGQYSKNSKQYYNDKYLEGIMRGYSPRQSRKVAEALTGDYQADRVQYLNGLLNSYGRDGLVTNEYGNQFIGELAGEDPQLASFYAQIYPNAKEAFNRYNTLEDKSLDHDNQVDLLFKGGEVTRANQDKAAKHNLKRDEIQHGYDKENAENQYRFSVWLARNQGEIDKEMKKLENELELGKLTYLEDYKLQLKNKEFQQQVVMYEAFADYLGYEGEDKKAFLTAIFGIKTADPKTGKFDKASVENGKKLHDMLDADEKNILKQMENELDPQNTAEYQAKLADIREFKQRLENQMGDQLGLGQRYQDFDTGGDENSEQRNVANVAAILGIGAQAGASEEQQFAAVRKWVPQDRTDLYVQGLIKKARGG